MHRVPGGKTATVYALRSELEAWLVSQEAGVEPAPEAVATTAVRPSRWRGIAMAGGAGVAAAALLWLVAPQTRSDLPTDAATAKLYVEARDAWAQRTAASLDRSIRGLRAVIARESDFAPAHAALAEAYLLAIEFGSLSAAVAYPRAKQSAERALMLDPDLAQAHRALGFVRYWWERDRRGAGQAFRRALALAPDQAQTHFWYANILADNGEQAAAMREFDIARLGDPGSVAIRTDRAWALWSGGDTGGAVRELTAIIAQDPTVATAHDCLADIALGRGDYRGYVASLAARERLRTEPGLRDHLHALEKASAAGDIARIKSLILQRALADEANSPFPNTAFAAFAASAAGDRGETLRILRLAQAQNQRWGSAGYVRSIATRWRGDSEIIGLLRARAGGKIERNA